VTASSPDTHTRTRTRTHARCAPLCAGPPKDGAPAAGHTGPLATALLWHSWHAHSHARTVRPSLCRPAKMEPQLDHAGPIMVPAGADHFKDIGRPRSMVDSNTMAGQLVGPRGSAAACAFDCDCVSVFVCAHVCMRACVCVCAYVRACVRACLCVRAGVHARMCGSAHTCVFGVCNMHMCMHVRARGMCCAGSQE